MLTQLTEPKFKEIESDMMDECQKHGTIKKLVVPRPNHLLPEPSDKVCQITGRYKLNLGAGFIYVQFNHQLEADSMIKAITKRAYFGRRVIAKYYSEVAMVNDIYM